MQPTTLDSRIKTEEKTDTKLPVCQESFVEISELDAIICMLINVFAPGIGTVYSGLIEYNADRKDVNGAAVMLGFIQFLLA